LKPQEIFQEAIQEFLNKIQNIRTHLGKASNPDRMDVDATQ